MTTISKPALRRVLDAHVTGANWRQCMAQVGAKENTAFMWMARSRDAEKRGDTSSAFYLSWPETENAEPDYWHKLISKARARRAMVLEAQMVSEAINGHEETVIVDGKIAWREDPKLVGMSDADLELLGYTDRLLRVDGLPVPLTRRVPMAATSRNMILQGVMPAVYGQHVNVNANVNKRVVIARRPPDLSHKSLDELKQMAKLTPPSPPQPGPDYGRHNSPAAPVVPLLARPSTDNPRGTPNQAPLDAAGRGAPRPPEGGFRVVR